MTKIATLELRKISVIDRPDYTFFIPSYQRGYRWDIKQVNELLDDIRDLMVTGKDSYCLQPVVVKTLSDTRFEVIDGQQRLTTIYLLLLRLKADHSEPFNLEYETRKDCLEFFKDLKQGVYDYNSNPDFAHMSAAYNQITNFVNTISNTDPIAEDVLNNVVKNVLEIIWYQVPSKIDNDRQDSIKIFTRLNIGKIPLTSAELIKAILLSTDNLNVSSSTSQEISLADKKARQIELANEWNEIEYELQNSSFWNFINFVENTTPTRIDFLFDLVYQTEVSASERNEDSFSNFYKKFAAAKANPPVSGMLMAKEWDQLKSCYAVLKEWYNDKELYHLIGYLIWAGKDIVNLYMLYLRETKTTFVKLLTNQVGTTLKSHQVDNLFYGKDSSEVTRVLVLLNVLEAKESKDLSVKFPFERLKLKSIKWSLEHIHAQNSEDINQKEYSKWLEDHETILNRMRPLSEALLYKLIELKEAFEQNHRAFDIKGNFQLIANEIIAFLSQQEEQQVINIEQNSHLQNPDHISNMALLDANSNSSLSNSVFAVKREKIINMDREGVFIPQATRNVFLKYYSDYPEHLIYWTIEDKQKYLRVINNKIKPFFKN
jgi:uncharacterized protein with ParB-like and HNH nuclease domain